MTDQPNEHTPKPADAQDPLNQQPVDSKPAREPADESDATAAQDPGGATTNPEAQDAAAKANTGEAPAAAKTAAAKTATEGDTDSQDASPGFKETGDEGVDETAATHQLPGDEEDIEYRYDAFISYRHVEPDRTWAKWLHKSLETYNAPSNLKSQLGFDPKIKRVFRDEDELPASAELGVELEAALVHSRFLIVISSPRIVSSRWCNAEVERFRELGRHDRILTLLVEGEPHESFLPALTQIKRKVVDEAGAETEVIENVEPLAADVRPAEHESHRNRKRFALLRILATMWGVRFDDLRQRESERRHRRMMAAASVLAALLVMMTGLTAYALVQRAEAIEQRIEADYQRGVAEDNEREAIAQKEKAEAALAEALNLLDAVIFEFSEQLTDHVGMRVKKEQLLEKALADIERIVERFELERQQTGRAAAVAMQKRGTLYRIAGRTKEADDMFGRALAILEPLAKSSAGTAIRHDLSDIYFEIGKLRQRLGDTAAAMRRYEQARKIREQIATAKPDDVNAQIEFAKTLEWVGDTQLDLGNTAEALPLFLRSLGILDRAKREHPDNPEVLRKLADAYERIGDINLIKGNIEPSRDYQTNALELRQQVLAMDAMKHNTRVRRDLAVSYNKLADIAVRLGEVQAAHDRYAEALGVIGDLEDGDRTNPQWTREYAVCALNLGDASAKLGEVKEAERYYKESLERARKLVEHNPDDVQARQEVARASQVLGNLEMSMGDVEGGKTLLQESFDVREALVERDAANVEAQRDLAISHDALGDMHKRLKETDAMLKHYRAALDIREKIAEADPDNATFQHDLTISYLRLGPVSDPQQALEYYRKALDVRKKQLAADPDNTASLTNVAVAHYYMGNALNKLGDTTRALEHLDSWIDLNEQVVETQPDSDRAQRDLAVSYMVVGDRYRAMKKPETAIGYYLKAIKIRRNLHTVDESDVKTAIDLVTSLIKLGDTEMSLKYAADALPRYQEAMKIIEPLQLSGKLPKSAKAYPDLVNKRITIARRHAGQ